MQKPPQTNKRAVNILVHFLIITSGICRSVVCIESIAVGAQIAGVGNKDLVHDVVQRTHQQRNNARDRILSHQLADALRAEKLIGTFHGIHLYLSILGQKNNGQPSCNRFYA